MRKLKIAIMILWIIFISGCIYHQQQSETSDYLIYYNSEYGIKIKYPPNWTKMEQVFGAIVVFMSPKENAFDNFQENLNIVAESLSTPITLEEYTDVAISQLKQIITDINIVETESTTLAGNPAHKIVYTGRQGQYILKWMQIWTIKNNKAYVITYTAEENTYSNFLGIVQEMINSFEII